MFRRVTILFFTTIIFFSSISTVRAADPLSSEPWSILESYLVPGQMLCPQSQIALESFISNGNLIKFVNAGYDVKFLISDIAPNCWTNKQAFDFFGYGCGKPGFSIGNLRFWEGIEFNDWWMKFGMENGAIYTCPNGVVGEWPDVPLARDVFPPEPSCLTREQTQLFSTLMKENCEFKYGCTVKVRSKTGTIITLILPTQDINGQVLGAPGFTRCKRDGFMVFPFPKKGFSCPSFEIPSGGECLDSVFLGLAICDMTRMRLGKDIYNWQGNTILELSNPVQVCKLGLGIPYSNYGDWKQNYVMELNTEAKNCLEYGAPGAVDKAYRCFNQIKDMCDTGVLPSPCSCRANYCDKRCTAYINWAKEYYLRYGYWPDGYYPPKIKPNWPWR